MPRKNTAAAEVAQPDADKDYTDNPVIPENPDQGRADPLRPDGYSPSSWYRLNRDQQFAEIARLTKEQGHCFPALPIEGVDPCHTQ